MRICQHPTPTALDRLSQQTADLSLLRHSLWSDDYKQVQEYNIKPVFHRLRRLASA